MKRLILFLLCNSISCVFFFFPSSAWISNNNGVPVFECGTRLNGSPDINNKANSQLLNSHCAVVNSVNTIGHKNTAQYRLHKVKSLLNQAAGIFVTYYQCILFSEPDNFKEFTSIRSIPNKSPPCFLDPA